MTDARVHLFSCYSLFFSLTFSLPPSLPPFLPPSLPHSHPPSLPPTPSLSPGVGCSKKLARRHAAENMLAVMEGEGMNTNPSLIHVENRTKVRENMFLAASVTESHELNV